MRKARALAWVFLGLCGGLYIFRPDLPGPRASDYERRIQHGVAERVLALNKLGKLEALSYYQYHRVRLEVEEQRKLSGQDAMRSLFSGRFLFELGKFSQAGRTNSTRLDQAQARREREKKEIAQARQQLMALDFHRYARPPSESLTRRD